jgi:hypothetical protein
LPACIGIHFQNGQKQDVFAQAHTDVLAAFLKMDAGASRLRLLPRF